MYFDCCYDEPSHVRQLCRRATRHERVSERAPSADYFGLMKTNRNALLNGSMARIRREANGTKSKNKTNRNNLNGFSLDLPRKKLALPIRVSQIFCIDYFICGRFSVGSQWLHGNYYCTICASSSRTRQPHQILVRCAQHWESRDSTIRKFICIFTFSFACSLSMRHSQTHSVRL